jgi:hypothetical protein
VFPNTLVILFWVQITTACLQSSTVRILLHSTDINTEQQESELGEIFLYSAFAILMTVKSENTINKYQSKTPNAISSSVQIPHLSSSFSVAETQPAPSNKFCRGFSSYTFQIWHPNFTLRVVRMWNGWNMKANIRVPKHIKRSWFQTFAVFCMLYVFFWVIHPESEFYRPTFRNTLSVPSS